MITFFLLIFFNLLIIVKIDKIASFVNIYDKPDKKLKIHKNKTPILGGFIFFFYKFYIINFLSDIFFLKNFYF